MAMSQATKDKLKAARAAKRAANPTAANIDLMTWLEAATEARAVKYQDEYLLGANGRPHECYLTRIPADIVERIGKILSYRRTTIPTYDPVNGQGEREAPVFLLPQAQAMLVKLKLSITTHIRVIQKKRLDKPKRVRKNHREKLKQKLLKLAPSSVQ
jgi:hypothetical protein